MTTEKAKPYDVGYDPTRYEHAGAAYEWLYLPWSQQLPDYHVAPLQRVYLAMDARFAGQGDAELAKDLRDSQVAVRNAINVPDTENAYGGSYAMLEDPGYMCGEVEVQYESWPDDLYSKAQAVIRQFDATLLAYCNSVDTEAAMRKERAAKAVQKIRNR